MEPYVKKINKLNVLSFSMAAALLLTIGQNAVAHTRLDTSSIPAGLRASNYVVITHGCGNESGGSNPVVGTSVVFPDGQDSVIMVDGAPHDGAIDSFLENWGNNNQAFIDHSVFDDMGEKNDDLGNVVGFWAAGGKGMPPNFYARVPFRTSAVNFVEGSCAKSVKVNVEIVDVCKVTREDKLHEAGVADLWTHTSDSPMRAGQSTIYDREGPADNGPASLTITNPQFAANPGACDAWQEVVMSPSAAQINRDMPIVNSKGRKTWPK